jgi:hypothetical protein
METARSSANAQFNWLLLFFMVALTVGALVRRTLVAFDAPPWLVMTGSLSLGMLSLFPLRSLAPAFGFRRHFLLRVAAISALSAAISWMVL